MIKYRKAFTLLELMVSLAVLFIGIIGILSVYIYCYRLSETSRNMAQAVNDARAVLEAMRDESNSSLWNVEYTNWNNWAMGTAATISGKTNTTLLNSLSGEQVNITMTEIGTPPLKIKALQVTIAVSWLESAGAQKSISVMSLVTQR